MVRSLLFVARTDLLESCWCSVIAFDGSARKGTSLCVRTTLLHCAPQALRGFAVTDDTHLSQVMSPSTRTHSMNREDSLTRSGQATPIPQGGNVSGRTVSNSLPAPPSVPSDHFYVHESDDCASGSASRSNTMQKTHCMDQEDMKNITLSMDAQELRIRNRI